MQGGAFFGLHTLCRSHSYLAFVRQALVEAGMDGVILGEMMLSQDELGKAVTHFAFDVQHFRCYAELDNDPIIWRICPAAGQAVRYSLLLHLRLLLDFFYGPPKKDDCWVHHFDILPGFSSRFPNRFAISHEDAREVSVNLHKRLAHLTATRWRIHAPDMRYYQPYIAGVEDLLRGFEAALPEDMRSIYLSALRDWGGRHPARVTLRNSLESH